MSTQLKDASADKLQKRISCFIIVSIILTSFIVTIASVYPFYRELHNDRAKDLLYIRDTSQLVVNNYLQSLQDISLQIASRTKAKQLTEEYLAGKINKPEMEKYLSKILLAAANSTPSIVSITRVDNHGNTLARVGYKMHINKYKAQLLKSNKPFFSEIYRNQSKFFTLSVTPIFDHSGKKIASDIIYFDISNITNVIYNNLRKTSKVGVVLAYVSLSRADILSSFNQFDIAKVNISKNEKITKMLTHGSDINYNKTYELTLGDINVVSSYGFIPSLDLAIVVYTPTKVLYSSLWKKLIFISITAALLLLILSIISLSLLKPLSGRFLLHSKELEDKVEEKTLELKVLNKELENLATHDELTGLFNRRAFMSQANNEIARSRRYQHKFMLIYLDLNKFKNINDTHGHEAGDTVLIEHSQRFSSNLRKTDICARLGGDEFVILLPEIPTNNEGESINVILEKLKKIGEQPLYINGLKLICDYSIGYSIYPKDGKDISTLLSIADEKMYDYKKNRKR